MVEKVENAELKCLSCGVTLTCRKKTYAAYKDKSERQVLQWQHAEGKAHYKWIAEGEYDCVAEPTTDNINTTSNVPEGNVNPNHDQIIALNLKVDKIYSMISEQYEFWKKATQQ